MKKILLLIIVAISAIAQSTMCFMENWTDIAKIEKVPLNGGKCDGKLSVAKMKEQGWAVEDIKISSSKTGMNYMYIFKKGSTVAFNGSNADEVSEEIMTRVEKRIEEKKEKKRAKQKLELQARGKNIYIKGCASCHGQRGEIRAYNRSRALNTLSQEEIEVSIRDYILGQKDNGSAFVMQPYVSRYTSEEFRLIAKYITNLK